MVVKDDDRQLIHDAGAIGKSMMKTIRQLADEQNRPVYEFVQAAIQALIVLNSVLLEEDPSFTEFKNSVLL